MAVDSGGGSGTAPSSRGNVRDIVEGGLNPTGPDSRGDVGDIMQGALDAGAKPPAAGGKPGDVVRKDGYVWEWNGQGGRTRWVALREVRPVDRRNIQSYAKYIGANEPAAGIDPNAPAIEDPTLPAADDVAKPNPGANGGTGDNTTGGANDRRGVPGGGKLWKVGNQYFLIYSAPRFGGGDPIQLAYRVRPDEVKAITGKKNPKVDRTVKDTKALDRRGIIRAGTSTQLADLGKHPWDAFREDFRDELAVRPWLKDPEMLGLAVEAHLEGRAVTEAEMANTDWWKTRTPAEREWVAFVGKEGGAKSPAVQQRLTDNRNDVERRMIAAGMSLPDDAKERVLDYLTREYSVGRLTDDALQTTIEQEANPYRTGATPTAGFEALPPDAEAVRYNGRTYLRIDGKDFALAKGLETAKYGANARKVDEVKVAKRAAREVIAKRGGTPQGRDSVAGLERVRTLIREWLGPQLMDGWKESEMAQWAQRIVENPQAENELITKLRATRAARYQGYDPELTYEDIARVGRSQFMDMWGQVPDEKDPLFQQILQMNDAGQAAQLLRQKGLERGVRQVVGQALGGLTREMGGQVVRSVV